jgi:hypothetical protein
MNRRRLSFVLVVVALAVAAQLASPRSGSPAHGGGSHESTLTALGHHDDAAIVPANATVRAGRAFGELLSVPLASVLAFAALLSFWCAASARRRERFAAAPVTYRRRGPPALLPVI